MKTNYAHTHSSMLLICIFLFTTCLTLADEPIVIYTPKGSPVYAYLLDEMSQFEIIFCNAAAQELHPNAILISSASRTYNCHGYAWHVSEGGEPVWINAPNQYIYWEDGSYVEMNSEAANMKVSYISDNHSAVTTTTNGWFISKWGFGPLMYHAWNDCPYNSSTLKYYIKYTNIPIRITIDQIFSTDNRVQQGATVSQVGHWETNAFVNYTVPVNFEFSIGNNETMRADTGLWTNSQTGNQEKYYTWNNDNNVVNHKKFDIQLGMSRLESQFHPTYPVTIQAQLIDGGNPGGFVEFKDPWLIDYPDPQYGNNLRNQGMSAPFKAVTSGNNNLGLNTPYKGVFLNQGLTPLNQWVPPFYTVRAPQEQANIGGYKGYFLNWSGHPDSVQFQNSNNRETPVVFKRAGAKATALYKGHLV